jgi:uncharacterized protein YgiM (DUF1202 family)
LVTQDKAALTKMEEVAEKYRLEGYATTEVDTVFALYQKNTTMITMGLGAILFFILTLLVVQRITYRSRPYGSWAFLLIFSVAILIHLNFGSGRTNAIISKNNTYLMDGPSGGASVVSIIRDGHRVKIKGKKDVWMKVQWGDKEVYIKETNLLPVTL